MAGFGVVYLILNTVNGKRYVGQTIQPLKKRFDAHSWSKKSLIGKAMRKYGKENFRYGVIKYCASKEEMDYWEKYFIVALKSKVPYGYNCTDGGDGTVGCTDETQASRSAKLKGVPKSSEHCAAIAAGRKGKFIGEKNHRFGKHHTRTASYTISMKQRGDSSFKNLLNEIDAFKFTYATLAKLMGLMSASSISDKMHGRKNFTARDIAKLVEIFNKPAEYLLKQEACAEPMKAKRRDSPYKNLLNELAEHDISYRRFAELMGISQAAVSRKMRGKQNFTERDKAKLVEFFGLPIEYLLERSED